MESGGRGVAEVRALHGARRVRRRLRGHTAFAVRVAEITGKAESLRRLAPGEVPVSSRTGPKTFRIGRPEPDHRAELHRAAERAERRVNDLVVYLQRLLAGALRRAEEIARLLIAALDAVAGLGPTCAEITRRHAVPVSSDHPPGQLLTSAPAVPHGPPLPLGPIFREALAA